MRVSKRLDNPIGIDDHHLFQPHSHTIDFLSQFGLTHFETVIHHKGSAEIQVEELPFWNGDHLELLHRISEPLVFERCTWCAKLSTSWVILSAGSVLGKVYPTLNASLRAVFHASINPSMRVNSAPNCLTTLSRYGCCNTGTSLMTVVFKSTCRVLAFEINPLISSIRLFC